MLYLWLIIFLLEDDVLINNEVFLVTDFVNLKIKLAQSFRYAHKIRMYVHIFIWINNIIICVYIMLLKNSPYTVTRLVETASICWFRQK
jgi:hypothetical protein